MGWLFLSSGTCLLRYDATDGAVARQNREAMVLTTTLPKP